MSQLKAGLHRGRCCTTAPIKGEALFPLALAGLMDQRGWGQGERDLPTVTQQDNGKSPGPHPVLYPLDLDDQVIGSFPTMHCHVNPQESSLEA